MFDRGAAQSTDIVFTPGEVAIMVGIPAHSVRRWAQYHAEQLSDGANPGRNQPRRFTQRDVEVLKAARPLHKRGLSVVLINERLRTVAIGAIEQSPNNEPTTALQVAQEGQESLQQGETVLAVVNALQSIVAPLAARLEALEENQHDISAQRLRVDVVWVSVACFIAGLIVGLAVWWF